jgi:hypothetical protein
MVSVYFDCGCGGARSLRRFLRWFSPEIVRVIQVRSTGFGDCSMAGSNAVHTPVPIMLIVSMIFPPYF